MLLIIYFKISEYETAPCLSRVSQIKSDPTDSSSICTFCAAKVKKVPTFDESVMHHHFNNPSAIKSYSGQSNLFGQNTVGLSGFDTSPNEQMLSSLLTQPPMSSLTLSVL